jgi:hypothetical protein
MQIIRCSFALLQVGDRADSVLGMHVEAVLGGRVVKCVACLAERPHCTTGGGWGGGGGAFS